MYTEIDLRKYVDFRGLAEAIFLQTGVQRTFVSSMNDYHVVASECAERFSLDLSPELLRLAMETRREMKLRPKRTKLSTESAI